MENMKPCPFCGGTNIELSVSVAIRKRDTATFHCAMTCSNCKAKGPRYLFKTYDHNRSNLENNEEIRVEAAKLWNNR